MNSTRTLTLRISDHSIAFSQTGDGVTYEPYTLKEGMAVAANLRSAAPSYPAANYRKVIVSVVSDVLLVPTDIYTKESGADMYYRSFAARQGCVVLDNVVVNLGTVALFSISKDMSTVITDNYPTATFIYAMAPVWRHLYQRSFTGSNAKLYAYFHDDALDIFCFAQQRFRFANTFAVTGTDDALYFLLYVFKQLALDAERDEVHLVGDIPRDVTEEIKTFIRKSYVINPSADFNRAAVTAIEGMPYDLMTLYVHGR